MKRVAAFVTVVFLFACTNPVAPAPAPAPPPPVAPPPVVAPVAPPVAPTATKSPEEAGFLKTWSAYRSAVADNDVDALAKIVTFPFKTRGPMDDDKEVTYNSEEFLVVAKHYLKQDAGWGDGASEATYVVKFPADALPDKTTIEDVNSGSVRVGESEFERVSGEWRWTFCYLNDDTITAINKELGKSTTPVVRPTSSSGGGSRPGVAGTRPTSRPGPASSGVVKTRPR